MGWWGFGIMEGDLPWDIAGDLWIKLGLESADGEDHIHPMPSMWSDEECAAIRKAFDQHGFKKLVEMSEPDDEWFTYKQVVAFLMCAAGAKLTDEDKDEIYDACNVKHEIEYSGEYDGIEERVEHLNQFIQMVEAYEGVPTSIEQAGLLEKVTGHLLKLQDDGKIEFKEDGKVEVKDESTQFLANKKIPKQE